MTEREHGADGVHTLVDLFTRVAGWSERPFLEYLVDPSAPPVDTLTYGQFHQRAMTVATNLQGRGLVPGDRVALVAPPTPDWISVFAGVVLAGGVPAPVNHHFTVRELSAYFAVLDPALVVAADSTRALVGGAIETLSTPAVVAVMDDSSDLFAAADIYAHRPPAVRPDDPGLVLHSSGTTGFPKAVLRDHGTVAEFLTWFADYFDNDERILNFLPLYHQAGLILSLLAAVRLGAPVVQQERYSTSAFWDVIARYDITHVNLVAPVPTFLLGQPPSDRDREHSLRWTVISGRGDHWADFQDRFGVTAVTLYGSTETLQIAAIAAPRHGRVSGELLRAVGHGILTGPPIAGRAEFRLIHDGGRRIDVPHEVGNIHARGDFMFREYLHDPDATANAFTKDGWFRTGDVGYSTEDGQLVLLGRAGGMIRRSGENIAPREVEMVLENHPRIQDALVQSVPDEVQGREIVARIVPAPGEQPTADEVFAYLDAHLSAFKVPRFLVFHERFERTPTMKIRSDLYAAACPEPNWIDRRRR